MQDQIIRAAGGLVWKDTGGEKLLAVVHRPRHNDWSLPKGKLKRGEEWIRAAVREVEEETACRVEPLDYAGTLSYSIDGKPKEVRYWHMKVLEEREFEANDEVDRIIWLPKDYALNLLDYSDERDLAAGDPPRALE